MTLFTAQQQVVLDVLQQSGTAFSKREYVEKKYREIGPVFLTAYSWFVNKAKDYVPMPEGAEYPYWVFRDPFNVPAEAGKLHRLSVPADEAIFFDMHDWNKILQLHYIGENEREEKAFTQDLLDRGLNYNKVMLGSFYPAEKQQIMESWNRLFRWHEKIKAGDTDCVENIQAALWCLKKEWFTDL